jgi:probable rRNA maturation factor
VIKLTNIAATPVDVVVDSPRWAAETAAEAAVRDAIATAAAVVRALPAATGEVSVVLTDDEGVRKLNREWRKIDKPTNVLSFPAAKLPPAATLPPCRGGGAEDAGPPALLGDIIIAYETTAREAAAEARPFVHHVAHLAVHGFLHLLGYAHDSDEEAEEMERLEARILARLDVPDPHMTQLPGT